MPCGCGACIDRLGKRTRNSPIRPPSKIFNDAPLCPWRKTADASLSEVLAPIRPRISDPRPYRWNRHAQPGRRQHMLAALVSPT